VWELDAYAGATRFRRGPNVLLWLGNVSVGVYLSRLRSFSAALRIRAQIAGFTSRGET
jgi:hypothetical protein